jgi:hypothetical protein
MIRITKIIASLLALLIPCGVFLSENAMANNATSIKIVNKNNLNRDFNFMSDFLKALNLNGPICKDYVKNMTPTVGTREEGTCHFNGQEITIDLFADSKIAATIAQSLKAFGGYILGSKNWTIYTEDGQTAKNLSNSLKLKIY